MTPFKTVALRIAGPTRAPLNAVMSGRSGGDAIIPPRLALAATVTGALCVIFSEQSVPLEGGMDAGTVGSQRPPNSRVTPLEFRPGKVPPGASAGTATGL